MSALARLTVAVFFAAFAHAATLEQVLAAMDAASASFQTMSAKVELVSHQGVVNEDSTDRGTIALRRPAAGSMTMLIELTDPNRKSVLLSGRKLELYFPKIRTVQEYDAGKNRQTFEEFLLLGFGSSGKDLAEKYKIRLLGEETVAGRETSHLELTPLSAEVLKHLKKAELWIAAQGAYPLRQKLYFAAGDYSLISYTAVRINPPLAGSALSLKLPKGVKREFPQK